MTCSILIIGGGIGGLTAALALQQQGVRVAVFEKTRSIGDVGAGISLGSSASKGLYALGLREALRNASDLPAASGAVHYITGERLGGAFAEAVFSDEDKPYVNQIHRADLFDILRRAVEANEAGVLHLDHEFTRFEQDADGVTAIFANGARRRGTILIGSDGINSQVRAQMFGGEQARFACRTVYRFLVPMQSARPFMSAGGSISYVAPDRSLLRYTIRHGSLVNCVAFVRSNIAGGEGWGQKVPADELLGLFPGWHPDVLGLARNAPADGTAKWALYDRDPLPVWTDGRVALLGDSAHPMLPFLGLGAAMSIEDGVVLARAISQSTNERDALLLYQKARSERAGWVLLASRHQGDIFADGPGGSRSPMINQQDRRAYDPSSVAL